MNPQPQRSLIADFNLLMAALIWGGNVVAMKYAITVLNPFYFNAFRFVFSVLTLAIWIAISRRTGKHQPAPMTMLRRTYIGTILIYSLLFGVFYQVAFLIGIYKTSATNTALIMSSVPMWTAIIAITFLGERLSLVSWLGLMTTFLGTMIVALDKPTDTDRLSPTATINASPIGQSIGSPIAESHAEVHGVTAFNSPALPNIDSADQSERQSAARSDAATTFWGNVIMLFCAIAWAVSTVVSRPLMRYTTPVRLAFWAIALSLPFHFLLAAWQPTDDFALQKATLRRPEILTATLYSGIFSTGIALAMWSFGVKILGASHAAIYSNLIPLIALLLGWACLSEVPTLLQIVGGAMIICGLLVMRRG
jgi:drug/metabolite transporter (DMT)-like permease